jgi:hypothetical protein
MLRVTLIVLPLRRSSVGIAVITASVRAIWMDVEEWGGGENWRTYVR